MDGTKTKKITTIMQNVMKNVMIEMSFRPSWHGQRSKSNYLTGRPSCQ